MIIVTQPAEYKFPIDSGTRHRNDMHVKKGVHDIVLENAPQSTDVRYL